MNNAGFAFKPSATESFGEQAERTLAVNYFGTRRACAVLFPLLRPGARVANMSSLAGWLKKVMPEEGNSPVRKRLCAEDLTADELDEMAKQFVAAAKEGTHSEKGWPNSTYCVSKVAVR